MISWMQKHNKFLIVTIWIATISFVFTGATYGFSYGLKSNNIGRVGDIDLSRDKFSMEYNNLFSQYNQMMKGKFDKEQAKQMGLEQQVLNRMSAQAKILNLANEFGIVVTDEETGAKLAEIPAFQNNGQFDRTIYDNFIKQSPFTQVTFEKSLQEQLTINKTFELLNLKGLENEYKAFTVAFEIADKLKYITLTNKDVNVTVDESKLKAFWDARKEQFKTAKAYTLDVVWTQSQDINVSEAEIESYYKENSFNYTDKDGKILPLAEAKDWISDDVKVKKAKKDADKRYIAFKKGEINKDETVTYDVNNPKLSAELWNEISTKAIGDLLKPKVVGKTYASVKIVGITKPVIKTFESVKSEVTPLYEAELKKEALSILAEETLKTIDNRELNVSNFITLNNTESQKLGLNQQETSNLITKLFTSQEEKGIIPIGDKVIVYKIVEQKLINLDSNETKTLYQNADQVKQQNFESNLMRKLDTKYPTEYYN